MKQNVFTFLIIDDHQITALGIESVLKPEYPNAQFIWCADGDETMKTISKTSIDFVFLDIIMPKTDTHSLLYSITHLQNKPPVLISSSVSEEIYFPNYLNMGAKGFISKSAPSKDIIFAVSQILSGKIYMSDSFTQKLVLGIHKGGASNPFSRLSSRELEVFNHLVQQKSNSEICEILNLAPSTIGTQKKKILEKLGVENIFEMIQLAKEHNIM